MNFRVETYDLMIMQLIVNRTRLALFLAAVVLVAASARGQQSVAPRTTTSIDASQTSRSNSERYRIGPGDVLDINVFGKPQFNRDGVRVDPRGMIRVPLVKDEIKAACQTEDELAANIAGRLREYVREPEVIVQIKEYQSEPVAVLGSVRSPSRFQLQRRVRLLELLTFVNGPADNAGRTVQVVHLGSSVTCDAASTPIDGEALISQVDYYALNDTLRGEESANPYVRAGDVISIAKADEVYIIGNVVRPTAILLTEPLTISRAIAMAGGTMSDAKKSEVHLVRQAPGSKEKQERIVDLEAINRRKAEDIVLTANDIIEVPTSSGKRFLRTLVGAVVPSMAQIPVKVIP